MDVRQQQKFIPPRARPPPIITNMTSERKVDEQTIKKFFLLLSEGNIATIKEFVINNKLSLNLVDDETGEIALHKIIKNTNITQDKKLSLIKFVVENGAYLSGFDKGNITPLHLAAKFQYYDIMKYLADKVDVNAKDSQLKTPLFYAITGVSTKCPVEKERPIIPEETTSLGDVKNIYNNILETLTTDADTKTYLEHIKNTMFDVENIYMFEIAGKSQDDIKKFVFDKLKDTFGTLCKKPKGLKVDTDITAVIKECLPFDDVNTYVDEIIKKHDDKEKELLGKINDKLKDIYNVMMDGNMQDGAVAFNTEVIKRYNNNVNLQKTLPAGKKRDVVTAIIDMYDKKHKFPVNTVFYTDTRDMSYMDAFGHYIKETTNVINAQKNSLTNKPGFYSNTADMLFNLIWLFYCVTKIINVESNWNNEDSFKEKFKKCYTLVVEITKLYNEMNVENHMKEMYIYVKKYYTGTFDVTTPYTQLINIPDMPTIPKIEEFEKKIYDKEDWTRKGKLFSLFKWEVSCKNVMYDVSIGVAPVKINAKKGFIISGTQLPSFEKDGLLGNVLTNVYSPELDKLTCNFPKSLIDDADATLIGMIGNMSNSYGNKNGSLSRSLPIFGDIIDFHFKMIKQLIIKKVLENKYSSLSKDKEQKPSDIAYALCNLIEEMLIEYIKDCALYGMGITNEEKSVNAIIPIGKEHHVALKISDIIKELHEQYKKDAYKITMTENLKEPNEHKTISTLINFSGNSMDKSCFTIIPKVTSFLIEKGANINSKDALGNTPLYYALQFQNTEIIKMLLDNGAVINGKHFKNSMGKTPFESYWDSYVDVVTTMSSLVNLTNITQNIKEKIEVKYGDNILRYTSMIIPMCVYLLNHQLYIYGKNFPEGSTMELDKNINNDDVLDIPVTTMISDERLQSSHKTSVDEYKKYLENKINDLSKSITTHKQQRDMITGDKTDIDKVIKDEEIEKYEFEKQIKQVVDASKLLITTLSFTKTPQDIVSDVYYQIYNHLNSTKIDFRIYPNMWTLYLNSTELVKDHTQIIQKICNQQTKIIGENISISDKIYKLHNIHDYYKFVLYPFVKNYFDWQSDIPNVQVDHVNKIIVHITQQLIFTNMYHLLVKLITKKLVEERGDNKPDNNEQTKITNIVVGVLLGRPNRIYKFIIETMPSKVVNAILNKGDINLIFDELTNRFITNKSYPFSKESTFINDLKKYIYPYFIDYTTFFVTEMKNTIDGYLKNIEYQYKCLEILNILGSKL